MFTKANKELSKIVNNKPLFYDLLIIILMGVFSVTSIFILNNAIASALYISTSTIISLFARLCFEENAK